MFDSKTVDAAAAIAAKLNVEVAALLAVAEVESAGKVFALVKGRQEPLIRFEGHYFDRRLAGAQRDRARREGLASPTAGTIRNPASQEARWALLARAMAIDPRAALESISIGVGQVMGAHWKKLGFRSPDDMVRLARRDAAGQMDIMARYIDKFGLADELQREDFTAFARGYNGPDFRANGYHTKMAAAFHRWSGRQASTGAQGMLRMGAQGAKVRELQTLLVRAGYPVTVDGDYGPATRDAVKAFQKAQRLARDGVAGPETFRKLEAWRQAPDERPGQQGVTDTREAAEGAGVIVGGGAIEAVRPAIEQAADKTSYIPGLEWLSAILSTLAALLVLGGIAWIAWGWLKARRTDEGDIDPPAPAEATYEAEGVLP